MDLKNVAGCNNGGGWYNVTNEQEALGQMTAKCIQESTSVSTAKQELESFIDQHATATVTDVLGQLIFFILLIILSPGLLAIFGVKSLTGSTIGQIILCIGIILLFNILCWADCYFNRTIGGYFCKKNTKDHPDNLSKFNKNKLTINISMVVIFSIYFALKLLMNIKKQNKK
jgi:hypothetical protein